MVVLIQSCDCLSFLGLYPKFQQFWTGNAVSAVAEPAGLVLGLLNHYPLTSRIVRIIFHPTALQHPDTELQPYEPPDFCDLTKPHSLSKCPLPRKYVFQNAYAIGTHPTIIAMQHSTTLLLQVSQLPHLQPNPPKKKESETNLHSIATRMLPSFGCEIANHL